MISRFIRHEKKFDLLEIKKSDYKRYKTVKMTDYSKTTVCLQKSYKEFVPKGNDWMMHKKHHLRKLKQQQRVRMVCTSR